MTKSTQEIITSVASKITERQKNGKPYFVFNYRKNGIRRQGGASDPIQAEDKRKAMKKNEVLGNSTHSHVVTKLSHNQIQAAEHCYSLLESNGFLDTNNFEKSGQTLIRSIQWFLKHYRDDTAKITIREAYEIYIEYKEKTLAQNTLDQYKWSLGKWFEEIGENQLSFLTPKVCYEWVYSMKSKDRQNTSFGYLQNFLNFCLGRNNIQGAWIKESPLTFAKPKKKKGDVKSLTVNELKDLLKSQPRSMGYIIFGIYSLMRKDEIVKFLKHGEVWNNPFILWEENRIHLPHKVASKDRGKSLIRHIPIEPVFMQWLLWMKKNKISISPHQFKPPFQNAIRHSAITFHNLAFQSTLDTSVIAGNSEAIIKTNYRNVNILKSEALGIYSDFTPEKVLKSIGIPIK